MRMYKGFAAVVVLIIVGLLAVLFFLIAFHKIPSDLFFAANTQKSSEGSTVSTSNTLTPTQQIVKNGNNSNIQPKSPTATKTPTTTPNNSYNYSTPTVYQQLSTPTPTSEIQDDKDNGPPIYSSG